MSSLIFRFLFVGAFVLASLLPEVPSLSVCFLMAAFVVVSSVSLGFFLASDDQKSGLIKISVVLLAFMWAIGWGSSRLDNRLAPELEGVDLWVEGRVDGLVSRQEDGSRVIQRMTLRVDKLMLEDGEPIARVPSKVRLSLYGGPEIRGGEGWRFQVRLKRPHGFANPGGFDYERWLLSRAIGATGYVRLGDEARVNALDSPPQLWRSGLRQNLIEQFGRDRSLAVMLALSMGDRSVMEESDAKTVQQMGLSHLLSISGLHIGLAAAVGFLIGRVVGACLSLGFPLRIYGPHCAWVCAVTVAVVYGWMAGFSLATQRALIMLVAAAIWYCCYRRYSVWQGLWVSMMAVLLLQPLSILEPGFWFSFGAVGVLLLLLSRPAPGWLEKLWMLLKMQLALFLIMGLLQLFWGMEISLASPLVNYLAVPFVSVVVVPLILFALFVSLWSQPLASYLWQLTHLTVDGFWWGLGQFSELAAGGLLTPEVQLSPLAFTVACLGLVLAILPLNLSTRILGLMAVLGVALPAEQSHRQATITVLDVGQGLAIVVGSRNRWFLYDTGPGYSESFDAGSAVVVPFLFDRGIRSLDLGVIGHWDRDHSGGFHSIQESMAVSRWIGGGKTPDFVEQKGVFEPCEQDSQLQIGDWSISVLGDDRSAGADTNNASCVLLLEAYGFRALLPGDIERSREFSLLSHTALQQPVDLLVAPHHGSGTSSSIAFVQQLSPRWVVFSAGYRNRYGHPQGQVVERYQNLGSELLYTSRSGAVEFQVGAESEVDVHGYRHEVRRYWR